jgi:hypothetical protein
VASKARRRKRRRDYSRPARPHEVAAADRGEPAAEPVRPRSLRPSRADRPPAPWGSFPLVELVVLLALALLIGGFVMQGDRGVTMIVAGMTLGLLAGLELTIREHFAGYRSHSSVLAGAVAVLALAITFAVGLPPPVKLLIGALAFASAFYAFREAFKRRSGGLGFR